MKILFLLLSFADLDKSSNMYSDLVKEFVNNGHCVYPVAPSLDKEKTGISTESGINVLRVKTLELFNVGIIQKGIANILLPYQYIKAIDCFYGDVKFDLVIMPTPPITLYKVVQRIKKRDSCKFYLILRDIFPQNAVDLGMMKKNIIYLYFRKIEKKLYKIADWIGGMSPANVNYIKRHNPEVDMNKLHILQNFQAEMSFIEKDQSLKVQYDLEGKFIVLFGGNMGIPQKLENVIALAKRCMAYKDVLYLIIGKGTQKDRIEKLANESQVTNIRFMDYIPREDYLHLVSLCDIGLISLNERFTIPNIPSKALSYFNLGVPVLASLDSATDFGNILQEANAGLWSVAGDIDRFKDNFDTLYTNPDLRQEMGINGKKYFTENMTPKIAYKVIMSQIS